MRRNARSDFPAPGGPSSKTPLPQKSRHVACNSAVTAESRLVMGLPIFGKGRYADDEGCALHRPFTTQPRHRGAIAIFGPDTAAVSFDDLLGDAQAEPRVFAEIAFRPVGIEAIENLVEIFGADSRSLILDTEFDIAARAAQAHPHLRVGPGEGAGI